MGVSPLVTHHYVARRLPPNSPPLPIDGDLNKPQWREVPWSTDFDDIRGDDAPDGSRPSAACRTRMKMRWDDEYLYVAALLESNREVVASLTTRNAPIYQHDSDFEVFIDAASSCHWYKELEVNAINTVWNLMLSRPYMDGGEEYSGRVATPDQPRFYEVFAQRSATRVLSGQLGDPRGASWAVEIALAHSDTLVRLPGVARPAPGALWRVNFSRVEEKGTINWVWAPQRVWEPTKERYEGKVNMHLPDAWGLVQFAPAEGALALADPTSMARQAAMSVYYAQAAYFQEHGEYAGRLDELRVDRALVDTFKVHIQRDSPTQQCFSAIISPKCGEGKSIRISHHRLVEEIDPPPSSSGEGELGS